MGFMGGEVYSYSNNNLKLLYENWSCDPLPDESILDFNKRSIIVAKKYIENYQNDFDNEILFSFVFSDCVIYEEQNS
jgi:hypothetical protein